MGTWTTVDKDTSRADVGDVLVVQKVDSSGLDNKAQILVFQSGDMDDAKAAGAHFSTAADSDPASSEIADIVAKAVRTHKESHGAC